MRTDDVFEQLSPCSTNTAMQQYFRQSPPQYSEILAEGGYTCIDDATTINTPALAQPPELACSPTLSSGYITAKDDVLFDKHDPSMEFLEVAMAQCYEDDYRTTTNVSNQCNSTQDYVDANFPISDPRHSLGCGYNFQNSDEPGGEISSLHDLYSSLVIDEEVHNSFEGSCSPIELTASPVEKSAEAIRQEENSSPKYVNSDSECGYIEFQSVIGEDLPTQQNPEQEMQNQLSESDIRVATPDSYAHQGQIDIMDDQFMDPHFLQDYELHSTKSDQLLRLSKCHGSVSSIDSGYVRTSDFS